MEFQEAIGGGRATPAEIFLDLWSYARSLNTFQRTTADPCADLYTRFNDALRLEDDRAVVAAVVATIGSVSAELKHRRNGAVMCAMRAIDEHFLKIHPRISNRVGAVTSGPQQAWLSRAERMRVEIGVYGEIGNCRLIARGPITRANRMQFSAGGEAIEDYFNALSVVPQTLQMGQREINIAYKVMARGGLLGVEPGKTGFEKIAFVPIACNPADLELLSSRVGKQGFVEVRVNVDSAAVVTNAINQCNGADLLIAPELTVDEKASRKIAESLRVHTGLTPRIVVAGSGDTEEKSEDGLAWNESVIYNGFGKRLWSQRKTWTSGFTNERADRLGLEISPTGFLLEKNAEADEVVVADVDGFGRCCVLICQDVQGTPLAGELLRLFQPDWVFVPILDRGVAAGRWAHQKVFELSAGSNARFIVASSLALVTRPALELPPIGLAIGPKAPVESDSDAERAYCDAIIDQTVEPPSCTIQWRVGEWKQTTLGASAVQS